MRPSEADYEYYDPEEEKSGGDCPAASCSPEVLEPCRVAYSLEEINTKLTEWMIETEGHPMKIEDEDERARWYQHNGMIHHFLACHFPDSEGGIFGENAKVITRHE